VLTCSRVSLGFVGEVFEVRTQVDHDLTPANRFDQQLGLIKNLGCHNCYQKSTLVTGVAEASLGVGLLRLSVTGAK
jgi:hypothetical protein